MLKYGSFSLVSLILLFVLLYADQYGNVSIWLYILLFLVFGAVQFYGAANIQSQFHLPAVCEGPTEKKSIALTFDDGPSIHTSEVLDVLAKHALKGTFFCIGKNIELHPEIMKRLVAEGHSIGNHSSSHAYFVDFSSRDKWTTEISETNALIKSFTGKTPRWFRPPFGVTTPPMAEAVKALKMQTIGWSVRSLDTKLDSADKILLRIQSLVKPGAIILLHDHVRFTPSVLESLILWLREENYDICSLEQLIAQSAYA
jgi:peptidoglycan/xylan/chitin deacetylase (PgdA/CDA1 family)